jgi:FSR family fosmidomycin resistance protein-like MFS transporter
MAAFIVVPNGQISVLAFTALAFAAILLLLRVANWQIAHATVARKASAHPGGDERLPRAVVWRSLAILVVLLFSKTFYLASLNSYYTFYLKQTFDVSTQTSQVLLFVFLAAVAAGTFAGGPIGDRIGRKYVIWVSILGVLPFTLLLPHLGLVGTVIDSVAIGLILSSAFSAMVVYAQELAPGNVGAIAGLFFGLSFGLGGLGAAALGLVADHTSLTFVYKLCGYLPAIGLLTYFLPDVRVKKG